MKYITFVVPCYNSAAYRRHCIDTLLPGGEDVEILIVNDGSTDGTYQIANEYREKYPTIVRAIHKENGGHGSGVNIGIEQAKGVYLKVVDSDDWVDDKAYKEYLSCIKEHVDNGDQIDLFFTNYVYENVRKHESYVANYKRQLPRNQIFTWKKVKRFLPDEFIRMHSLTYSVDVLRKTNTRLLEKTFYVDNIYTYQPLVAVQKMFYLPVDLYRYFIGRSDQSVNIANRVKRYDQQLRVRRYISLLYTKEELKKLPKKQYRYRVHLLAILSYSTRAFIYCSPSDEKDQAYKEYRNEFKQKNRSLYTYLEHHTRVKVSNLRIPPVRKRVVRIGYKLICKQTKWG